MLQIYTDGSCTKTKSGLAFLILRDNNKIYEFAESFSSGTNQQMELAAAFKACVCAKSLKDIDEQVIIYSDSAYLINCYQDKWYINWRNNNWINSKKEPVANKSLWEKLIPFFIDPEYTFVKVKGHSGDIYNERVDKLATGNIQI